MSEEGQNVRPSDNGVSTPIMEKDSSTDYSLIMGKVLFVEKYCFFKLIVILILTVVMKLFLRVQ